MALRRCRSRSSSRSASLLGPPSIELPLELTQLDGSGAVGVESVEERARRLVARLQAQRRQSPEELSLVYLVRGRIRIRFMVRVRVRVGIGVRVRVRVGLGLELGLGFEVSSGDLAVAVGVPLLEEFDHALRALREGRPQLRLHGVCLLDHLAEG